MTYIFRDLFYNIFSIKNMVRIKIISLYIVVMCLTAEAQRRTAGTHRLLYQIIYRIWF